METQRPTTHRTPGWSMWKWLMGGTAAALVAIAVVFAVSLTLLNEEWLKRQLITHAREAFDIELEIDSLDFHPWQGEAELYDVTFNLEKPNQDIHAEIESLHVKMAIWPLLFREVDVENLTVVEPQVTYLLDRPPEQKPRPTLDQVAEKVVAVLDNLVIRIVESLLESFHAKEGYDIRIGQLEVIDGELDCTVNRPDVAPAKVLFEHVDYSASDLQPSQRSFGVWGYVAHADIDADLRIGDSSAGVEHHFATLPHVIKVTGLDLGQTDRLGSQQDAIVFNRGTLDLSYQASDDTFEVEARFTDLQLDKNQEADLPDLLFIPVDHLIAYIEENEGNLVLQFSRKREVTAVSNDMEFVIAEIWKGMWSEVLRRFQAEAGEELEHWKAKGTEKLRHFLRNKELLNEEGSPP